MPVLHQEEVDFILGKGILMQDGHDVALIGTGTVLSKAVAAAAILEEAGISVRLIDMHTVKPLDRDLILSSARAEFNPHPGLRDLGNCDVAALVHN